MIKKILCAFLLGITLTGAYADVLKIKRGDNPIDLYAERAVSILQKYIPDDAKRQDVIDEILLLCKLHQTTSDTHKHALELEQLKSLCVIAGWDLAKDDGIQTCENFIKSFLSLSITEFFEVCGKDRKQTNGVDERCVDNFFYAGVIKNGTRVPMMQGVALCKEYARLKYNDTIECSDDYRTDGRNDFIKCRSMTDAIYYEFKFDSLVPGSDSEVDISVTSAVCAMHDTQMVESPNPGIYYDVMPEGWNYACKTPDSKKCEQINNSMSEFAFKTYIKHSAFHASDLCVIDKKYDIDVNNLRTAFGINNRAFDAGMQLSAGSNLEKKLCEYIRNNANVKITTCKCDSGPTRSQLEDILTCFANDEPIDFIFDDLNEGNKKIREGNMEAFNCTVLGGQYQGKTCYTPDKALCDKIAAATLSECPECAKAYFDTEKNACILPNATKAIQHQKNVNIALLAGGVVVNVGLTLYFGGTNWAYFVLVVDSAFAGMELGGQMHIDGVADTFFTKANNCNNATCAEEILKEYFMYLARMTNDLQDGELTGADAKFAKLVEMLPEDSQFLIDLYISGCYTPEDENLDISKCDDGKWNTDQIIRAIGIAGQLFTLVGAGVKAVVGAERISRVLSKTPGLEKALTKKIPGVRESILRKLSKGGQVLRSDGKAILKVNSLDIFDDVDYLELLQAYPNGSFAVINKKTGFTEIRFPQIDIKQTKYVLKYNYIKGISESDRYIFTFTDSAGRSLFLTGTPYIEEITRTKKAYEIFKNSQIVNSVKIIDDDQTILKQFASQYKGVTDVPYWFVTEEIPVTLTKAQDVTLQTTLRGKPITIAEKQEIYNSIKKLNESGINHGDLKNNLFIIRNSDGKLRVDILDYDPSDAKRSNDKNFLDQMFSMLQQKGCAEYETEKGVRAVNQNGVVKIIDTPAQDLMSNPTMVDNMIAELWNEAGYNASIPQVADDFESLAEKFGIQQEFGFYEPRNIDEATQMLRRIQDQLDDTEQILNKYADELGETDDYFRTRNIFEQDKGIAEDYIRHLNDYLQRGGLDIEHFFDELWTNARYNATRPAATDFESLTEKFGIQQDFGGYNPESAEEAYHVLNRIQNQIEDIRGILRKYADSFGGTDDFERIWHIFNQDEYIAEQYINFLRGRLEYFDIANR